MKTFLQVVGFLGVFAVGLAVWIGHKQPDRPVDSYALVMPEVGECATVEMHVQKGGVPKPSHRAPDYRVVMLRVKCTASKGLRRSLDVSYLPDGKPAYSLEIDYSTNRVDERIVVRSPDGERLHRTQLVDGNPVPFHYLLNFDKKYLGSWGNKLVPIGTSSQGRLLRHDTNERDGSWGVEFNWDEPPGTFNTHSEYWRKGQWLWSAAFHASTPSSNLSWVAGKKPTGAPER